MRRHLFAIVPLSVLLLARPAHGESATNDATADLDLVKQIGRASCRERV